VKERRLARLSALEAASRRISPPLFFVLRPGDPEPDLSGLDLSTRPVIFRVVGPDDPLEKEPPDV
jgi:hypothetical protein